MTATPPEASSSSSAAPKGNSNRYSMSAVDKQKAQLDKLLKDPTKLAHIPVGPKDKTIRPAREMMKNVQGSSAGAGSGEFHVYKASRRREYERLKLMGEQNEKERVTAEFEQKRSEAEAAAEAKTAKNRAKRQKKKQGKARGGQDTAETSRSTDLSSRGTGGESSAPLKKRRLINGKELLFKAPGEESDAEDDQEPGPVQEQVSDDESQELQQIPVAAAEVSRVIIHDD